MDMIAVGDVAFVRHSRNYAEPFLQAFGKFVGCAFQRSAIDAKTDRRFLLPAVAGVVHVLHYLQRKRCGFWIGVGFAGQVAYAFAQSGISQRNGRITADQQFVDRLSFFQPGNRAMLPENRSGIGQRSFQPVVAAHQRFVAQLQPFVKNLPELIHVSLGGQRHIDQIDGYDALIETTVEFVVAVFIFPRAEVAAAAHDREAVAFLQLFHLLFRNVIRNHALGRAFGRQFGQIIIRRIFVDVVFFQHVDQLRESRRNPDALFVFNALIALLQRFLNDQRQVFFLLFVFRFVQIHEDGDKRRLTVGRHQGYDLILNGLHAFADLFQ